MHRVQESEDDMREGQRLRTARCKILVNPSEIVVQGAGVSQLGRLGSKTLDCGKVVCLLGFLESAPFAAGGWSLADPGRSRRAQRNNSLM